MIENLIKLVSDNAQDLIVNNQAVPNQHNNQAINMAAEAIKGGLGQAVAQGNIQDILGLFSNPQQASSNPLASSIISNLAGNLSGKLGVDSAQASGIASSLIPMVLSQFAQKSNDPNDNSFDINGIMSAVTGGKTGGVDFASLLTQFNQNGGKMDLSSVASMLLGGNKAGGLGGLISKLFGR